MSGRTCERAGCDRPHVAHGLCATHYHRERDRTRHRHREGKVIQSRARSRATTALINAHRDEFQQLLTAALVEVIKEAGEIDQAHAAENESNVKRLRPGPPSIDDQDALDRVALRQPVTCTTCESFHERGHKCPVCAVISRAETPRQRRTPEQRIEELLRCGKSAQWVSANLGEPMVAVMVVLDRLRRERTSA